MPVSVYGLEGSTGSDFFNTLPCGLKSGKRPPVVMTTPCPLFWASTDDTSTISSVLILQCIAMRPQLYVAVINIVKHAVQQVSFLNYHLATSTL